MTKARFQIAPPEAFTAITIAERAAAWNRDPIYQRQAEAWDTEKQALFVDSLLNGFLIPPMYLHEYQTPVKIEGKAYSHAVVDGKQRLRAIDDFLNDRLRLSDLFVYEADRKVDVRGMTIRQIRQKHPKVLDGLTATPLTVVSIRSVDPEYINQLFARINEGVRLNPAEKRNAMPGPFPPATRRLAQTHFFLKHYPRNNRRYHHFEMAAKFLAMEAYGATSLRPSELDDFARGFIDPKRQGELDAKLDECRNSVQQTLDVLMRLVPAQHEALHGTGLTSVLYLIARDVRAGNWTPKHPVGPQLDGFKEVRSQSRLFVQRKGEKPAVAAAKVARFNLLNQRNEAKTFEERKQILEWFCDAYSPGADPVKFLGLSQAQLATFN